MAILFSHTIIFDIINVKQDTDDRFLLTECNIFGENYTLMNIYAPTGDKSKKELAFGKCLLDNLESHVGSNLILAGDVNTDLDDVLGKSNVSKSAPNYKFYLQKLADDLDLLDICHLKHSQKKRLTRHENNKIWISTI